MSSPPPQERKESHASEKLGTITVEVADRELDKIDEYEAVIAAEVEFTCVPPCSR
jgi:hypothetical protein